MWQSIYDEMASNYPPMPTPLASDFDLDGDMWIALIIQIANIAHVPIIIHRQDALDVIKDHPMFTTNDVAELPIEYYKGRQLIGWLYDIPVVISEGS